MLNRLGFILFMAALMLLLIGLDIIGPQGPPAHSQAS